MRDIHPETDQPPTPSAHTAATQRVSVPRDGTPRDGTPRSGSAQATAPLPVATVDRWRLLRLVFAVQGLYYVVTGLWPLLARVSPLPPLFSATNLGGDFADTLIQALTLLVGAVLLLTVARPRPDGLLVGLGLGGALAFFLVELRFRTALRGLVYADLALEVVFFFAMLVIYLAALWKDRRTPSAGRPGRGS